MSNKTQFDYTLILAGGKGRRLVSEVGYNRKPVAIINNNPALVLCLNNVYPYSKKIIVVANDKNFNEINDIVIKFSKPNIEVVIQKQQLGTANAVSTGVEKIYDGSLLVVCCDNIFPQEDTECVLDKINYFDMVWVYHIINKEEAKRYAVYQKVNDNYLLVQKPQIVTGNKCWSGPIAFSSINTLKEILLEVKMSPLTNEYELVDVLNHYLLNFKSCSVLGNSYFFDIGTPESYEKAKTYFIMEKSENVIF